LVLFSGTSHSRFMYRFSSAGMLYHHLLQALLALSLLRASTAKVACGGNLAPSSCGASGQQSLLQVMHSSFEKATIENDADGAKPHHAKKEEEEVEEEQEEEVKPAKHKTAKKSASRC